MSELDPFRLDRTIASFARQHARFRAALRNGTFAEHAFEFLPPELDAHLVSVLDRRAGRGDPLAGPSARWLRFLLVEHACSTASGNVARAERVRRFGMHAPEPGEFTFAELLKRALTEAPRRDAWLGALVSVSADVGALRLALWDRRLEKSAELGTAPLALDADAPETHRVATAFLEQTRDAFEQLRLQTFEGFVERGLGRETPGSFPGRISTHWLADLFREGDWLKSLDPKLDRLPSLLGVSSLLLSLERFGAAFHDAAQNAKQPFVLGHDPRGTRRAVFAGLFGLLPFTRTFAAHRFEVGRATAPDYLRSLANVVLLGSRLLATRAILCFTSFQGDGAYRERFGEVVPMALGFEPAPALAGAILGDEQGLTRFAGWVAGAALAEELTETHDEDWFRNPRAVEALRAELDGAPPLELEKGVLERGAALLTRRITESL